MKDENFEREIEKMNFFIDSEPVESNKIKLLWNVIIISVSKFFEKLKKVK